MGLHRPLPAKGDKPLCVRGRRNPKLGQIGVGLDVPTGRNSPSPRARPGNMGAAVFGRLRPYHFEHPGTRGPRREPVPSVTRWNSRNLNAAGSRGTSWLVKTAAVTPTATVHTVAEDIVSIEREIGQLMHDIEARVGKLKALARRSAKDAARRRQPNSFPTRCRRRRPRAQRRERRVGRGRAAGRRRDPPDRGRGRPAPFADAGHRRRHRIPRREWPDAATETAPGERR